MDGAVDYDLCVVGSGVAGALVATVAARRGLSVVLVEAGSRFAFGNRLEQLRRHQILGTPLWPWTDPARDVYVDSSSSAIQTPYHLNDHRVKAVGGSTLHWGGRANRLLESDFRTASLYGLGVDWPIGYADLEPYYARAEQEIGVSGTRHATDPPRSTDYPMPGFPPSYDDVVWRPLATRIALRHSPHAIASVPYRGRSSCMAYASCNVCPSGARYSADWHVREAEASGRCTLLEETVARRIDVDASGRVKAIFASHLDGRERELRARRYVVAAHAVESARLLLLSNVGNGSDQVGRNLMEHPYVSAGGFQAERLYPFRVGFELLESYEFYDGEERRSRGAIKLELGDWFDPLARLGHDGLWGTALARFDRERFGHWIGIGAETEQLPNPASRVTLDPTVTDGFGDPAPHVHLAFDPIDLRTQERAHALVGPLLEACGVAEVEHAPGVVFAAHQMGTCRMSDDPARGVVDRNCRVHGTSNLYLAGSSVFPTGGAVQPTLSIAALALRLADHLTAAATPG